MFKVENDIGDILITKNAIADIVGEAVTEFNGKIFLCSSKGKNPVVEPKNANIMDIQFLDTGVDIKIYILIKFGTSIALSTRNLINTISEKITELTAMNINNISVVVVGIFSKKVAKRNIEVKK